ncbi:MAG: 50S ribosomal protein L29 [Anaerolineae bacterium]|nr:50S ribosomal protein L29 [Anaerolineae bacterium]MDW8100108.1 50S ribosomal protein L29 [Anaerolineae bacterium]
MKASEIRAMTDEEIARKLDETYQELFNLRFQLATGQLRNTARLSQVKRDIARLRTILRERELAAWYQSTKAEG